MTENDISNWDDETGIKYHYPSRYKNKIEPGTKIVYYKGRIKDAAFKARRLSYKPHYFGTGIIGKVIKDSNSNNYFASILDFRLFNEAVDFKDGNIYLEDKANLFSGNYFRGNAVRSLSEGEYFKIISKAELLENRLKEPNVPTDESIETQVFDGRKISYYSTRYERNKSNRDMALKIHGYNCVVCNINFKQKYGEVGEGFIHIHHIKPLYSLDEEVVVDPSKDLVPVCPNCHAMIHRKKNSIYSIEELKLIYKGNQ